MTNEKIIFALFQVYEQMEQESKKIYNFLSKFLQEESHSFGFKPFSDLSLEIVNKLDEIYKTEIFGYYFYEFPTEKLNIEKILNLIKNEIDLNEDKEAELLTLYINILKKLSFDDLEIGKEFSLFVTDLKDDPSKHSFLPMNDMINYMINKIEVEVYPEINYIKEKAWKDYGGLFYWFCIENNYGKKKLKVAIPNEAEIIVDSIEKFIEFINIEKKAIK